MSNNSQLFNQTLGVEQELRRFAIKEYLEKQNNLNINVIGSNDINSNEETQDDDLLATNPIIPEAPDNLDQEILGKIRYSKKITSYINIHSGARNKQLLEISGNHSFGSSQGFMGGSLLTSDGIYTNSNNFAPYSQDAGEVNITANNNHMSFSIKNHTDPHNPKQLISSNSQPVWNIYIPPGKYTVDNLAFAIQKTANQIIKLETNINDLFKITAHIDPIMNSDRVTIIITVKINYQFIWTFHDNSQFSIDDYSSVHQGLLNLQNSYAPQSAQASHHLLHSPYKLDYHPNPNYYKLYLDKIYHNVNNITIVSSEIPNSDTIINIFNNHITFAIKDRTKSSPSSHHPYNQNILTKTENIYWDLYIQPGNYTVTELAVEMELAINNMVFGEAQIANMFNITADTKKGIFEINVNHPYSFLFDFNKNESLGNRNLYQMLGFISPVGLHPGQYVTHFNNLITVNTSNQSKPKYVQIPYSRFNLRKSNIIWLKINHFDVIYDTLTKDHYFAKFTIDHAENNPVEMNSSTPVTITFNDGCLPKLETLDISFFDENGLPYNFNNVDHSFTLEITHHLDRLLNNGQETRRGINENIENLT